jgi:molecular chaperone HscB
MPTQEDYFRLFDLPRRYGIDPKALEAAYERLTLAHHPDFFPGAEEKKGAESVSARVNEGYRVLADDLARAGYLLGLLARGRGLNSGELPPGFLQDMFLLQEEVEALDDAARPERRATLAAEAGDKLRALRDERERLFADAGEGGELSLLQAIQSNLNCERYLRRLLDNLTNGPHPSSADDPAGRSEE